MRECPECHEFHVRGEDTEAALTMLTNKHEPGKFFVTRLDAGGKPTGEGFEIKGSMTGRITPKFPETPDSVETVLWKNIELKRYTVDLMLNDVDPNLLTLLFGHTLKPRPWWWKFIPRPIRNRVKRREVRRGYGG